MGQKRKGFTLVELLVVVGIIALLLSILLPSLSKAKEITNRTKCASNLRSIAQGLQVYAPQYNDLFPKAGTVHETNTLVFGFAASLRATSTMTIGHISATDETGLANNATASLWILVRQGSAGTDLFICPSSGDTADDLTDNAGSSSATESTWDFKSAENLSYSPMNMFGDNYRRQWTANAGSNWPIAGDDNNASTIAMEPAFHSTFKDDTFTADDLKLEENSQHHSNGEGQVFVFGDGHAKFFNDPFVGPANDNAYAEKTATNVNTLRNDSRATSAGLDAQDALVIPVDTVTSIATDVEGLADGPM